MHYERYAVTVHQGVRQCDSMQGKTRERWQELCEQAANEKDPTKMLEIVEEINRLLAVKYDRLNQRRRRRSKDPQRFNLTGYHTEPQASRVYKS